MPSPVQEITAAERAILRLVSEQQAVQIDHLARFFELGVFEMAEEVERLRLRGWVVVDELLTGQSPWVGTTHRGARLAGTGFGIVQPSIRNLLHTRSINEARLRLINERPEGMWVCERELRRRWQRNRVRNIPDAIFEVDGERWAVEVELSVKSLDALRANIREHASGYDRVVYFCSKVVASLMERKDLMGEFPGKLFVWETFEPNRELDSDEFQVEKPVSSHRLQRRSAKPTELPVLDLLAEQGAIPLDQLARFLSCDLKEATALSTCLLEAGFVSRSLPLVDEPQWLWLTSAGAKASTTDLNAMSPKVGGLGKRRALNEIRLLYAARVPGARWVSDRTMRRAAGMKGSLPAAVVVIGDPPDCERHAIEVCLSRKSPVDKRMDLFKPEFDAATFFYAAHAENVVKLAATKCAWSNLAVQQVPDDRSASYFLDSRSSRPPFEPVEIGEVVDRLRAAVEAERVQPPRARSIVGYLLLREAGAPAGGKRTEQELQRDCRELGLLADSASSSPQRSLPKGLSRPAVDELVSRACREVKADRLASSRARTLVGFSVLSAVGVPQGASRTVADLRRDLSALLDE